MEWQAEGHVVGVRRHGETSVILDLFTAERGRHVGIVLGGRSRRLRPVLQPGNSVRATWRARLEEQMGTFTVEPTRLRAGEIMRHPAALHALNHLCALARLLPERDPHEELHRRFGALMDSLSAGREYDDADRPQTAFPQHAQDHDGVGSNRSGAIDVIASKTLQHDVAGKPGPVLPSHALAPALVSFELALLADLGFGLDLTCCAATGRSDDLAFVSPRTGRAVSRAVGEPYRDRIMVLPPFLMEEWLGHPSSMVTMADTLSGFRLTEHFLLRDVFAPRGLPLPDARRAYLATLMGRDA